MAACEYCGKECIRDKRLEVYDIWLCDECWFHSPPKIVCLCGSTKFMDDYREIMLRETLAGNIVLTVGNHLESRIQEIHDDPDIKRELDWLHMQKIKMSSRVHFINREGYIGESTARELAMARKLNKQVTFEWPEYE